MQLIDIATTSIALFGTVYFIAALVAHLHFCWSNPHTIELKRFDRKLAAIVEAIAPAVEPLLLLPPAVESHPFELSLERMPALEPIAAVHQPAAAVVQSIKLSPIAELLDVETTIAVDDLSAMSIRELKKLAKDRRIPNYSRLSKLDLLDALS